MDDGFANSPEIGRLQALCICLLFLALSGPAWGASVIDLPADQAWRKLQGEPVYLLDVRTLPEYQQVRLADAHLIPINDFLARESEVPTDRSVLVYCAVGARSQKVAAYLAGKGHTRVFNLRGGISAWQLRGLPVQKGLP